MNWNPAGHSGQVLWKIQPTVTSKAPFEDKATFCGYWNLSAISREALLEKQRRYSDSERESSPLFVAFGVLDAACVCVAVGQALGAVARARRCWPGPGAAEAGVSGDFAAEVEPAPSRCP